MYQYRNVVICQISVIANMADIVDCEVNIANGTKTYCCTDMSNLLWLDILN